jgi:NAD(P)-dependent dehydrogenase (short-subunit alcohol dehydrogenase family)
MKQDAMKFISRRRFTQAAILSAFAGAARSAPAFSATSTAEEVTDGIDLKGKTALVTGCNSGVGYETMRVLALRGALVIGTGRTADKAAQACKSVKGKAVPAVLELTDFDSVVACAEIIRRMNVNIDMLICNAGIVLDRWEEVRGLEKQFVVNHLGHFILVNRLQDKVIAAPQGRIIVVGSGNHRDAPNGGIQFDDLSGERWYKRGYAHSKLANGLFSLELSRRLKSTRATSNCVTPGPTRTAILRNTAGSTANYRNSVAQGAATPCYVATSPALSTVSGEYFKDCAPAPQGEYQTDPAMAARLWKVSEDLTSPYLG